MGETDPTLNRLGLLNDRALSPELLGDLRSKGWIRPGSPYWWSTDYTPDPREFMSFEDFSSRLVDAGRNLRLYTEPQVPMTTLDLVVDDLPLRFMVTARPYHPKEQDSGSLSSRIVCSFEMPIDKIKQHIEETGQLPENYLFGGPLIPSQCFPHIRGVFVEARGTHLFYSVIREGKSEDFRQKISDALLEAGLAFIHPDDFTSYSDDKTYQEAHAEAAEKELIIGHKSGLINFEYEEVALTEFLAGWQHRNLLVHYPVRLDGFSETMPIVVASRTHSSSKIIRPAALGIYGLPDADSGYLWRFKDEEMARIISRKLTQDYGLPVDTVLCTPQPGRPKYERVSGY